MSYIVYCTISYVSEMDELLFWGRQMDRVEVIEIFY